MTYNIRVLEIKENNNDYDVLIHVYNGEVKEENCIHIMTITLTPKPTLINFPNILKDAIKSGMSAYLNNRSKVLTNQPTRVYGYNETTGELI